MCLASMLLCQNCGILGATLPKAVCGMTNILQNFTKFYSFSEVVKKSDNIQLEINQ